MSQFSEKLKCLVEDSGLTIYHLSQDAGLDRTTIQRSISGERLPSVSFVEKLCDYLRVSPAEREDLIQRHAICKIGESVYSSRKYVESMIEQVAGLHIYRNENAAPPKYVIVSDELAQEIRVVEGFYSVNQLIRAVLEDEVYNSPFPSISLTVPFSFGYLFDCLQQLYWEHDGKASIQHLVQFRKDPHTERNPNINLEMLSHVLPLAFCMGSGYQPHYYYAASHDAEYFVSAMPFFLFTGKRLVTLSSDYKTAILYNNSEVLRAYQAQFQRCLVQSSPLVQQLSGPLDMIMIGFEQIYCGQKISHVIEPQPCFATYYTHEMVEEYLRSEVPNRDKLKEGLLAIFDCYRCFNPHSSSFFTINGLKTMVKTGEMADLPAQFTVPFSVETRLYLLKLLREDIQQELYFCRAIDTSKLQISPIATMQLYDDQSILFMATTDNGMVACKIREQSVFHAFQDFFVSMSESKLLYSKDDTLKIIDAFIAQLEAVKNDACNLPNNDPFATPSQEVAVAKLL